MKMQNDFGGHCCGEGGEFESLTLDCPIYKKRVIIDESEVLIHSEDSETVVAYLKIRKAHLETK
jgi:diphthine-ammonia ligase